MEIGHLPKLWLLLFTCLHAWFGLVSGARKVSVTLEATWAEKVILGGGEKQNRVVQDTFTQQLSIQRCDFNSQCDAVEEEENLERELKGAIMKRLIRKGKCSPEGASNWWVEFPTIPFPSHADARKMRIPNPSFTEAGESERFAIRKSSPLTNSTIHVMYELRKQVLAIGMHTNQIVNIRISSVVSAVGAITLALMPRASQRAAVDGMDEEEEEDSYENVDEPVVVENPSRSGYIPLSPDLENNPYCCWEDLDKHVPITNKRIHAKVPPLATVYFDDSYYSTTLSRLGHLAVNNRAIEYDGGIGDARHPTGFSQHPPSFRTASTTHYQGGFGSSASPPYSGGMEVALRGPDPGSTSRSFASARPSYRRRLRSRSPEGSRYSSNYRGGGGGYGRK